MPEQEVSPIHKLFRRSFEKCTPRCHYSFAQYCAALFGTSALVESVFSIDGLGIYLTEACESMDVYGISGAILICAILFVLFNTVADILSSVICPAYRRKRV